MLSKPMPRAAPGLYRIDTFSLVTHWGLKEGVPHEQPVSGNPNCAQNCAQTNSTYGA